jgi:hypothetical protein
LQITADDIWNFLLQASQFLIIEEMEADLDVQEADIYATLLNFRQGVKANLAQVLCAFQSG